MFLGQPHKPAKNRKPNIHSAIDITADATATSEIGDANTPNETDIPNDVNVTEEPHIYETTPTPDDGIPTDIMGEPLRHTTVPCTDEVSTVGGVKEPRKHKGKHVPKHVAKKRGTVQVTNTFREVNLQLTETSRDVSQKDVKRTFSKRKVIKMSGDITLKDIPGRVPGRKVTKSSHGTVPPARTKHSRGHRGTEMSHEAAERIGKRKSYKRSKNAMSRVKATKTGKRNVPRYGASGTLRKRSPEYHTRRLQWYKFITISQDNSTKEKKKNSHRHNVTELPHEQQPKHVQQKSPVYRNTDMSHVVSTKGTTRKKSHTFRAVQQSHEVARKDVTGKFHTQKDTAKVSREKVQDSRGTSGRLKVKQISHEVEAKDRNGTIRGYKSTHVSADIAVDRGTGSPQKAIGISRDSIHQYGKTKTRKPKSRGRVPKYHKQTQQRYKTVKILRGKTTTDDKETIQLHHATSQVETTMLETLNITDISPKKGPTHDVQRHNASKMSHNVSANDGTGKPHIFSVVTLLHEGAINDSTGKSVVFKDTNVSTEKVTDGKGKTHRLKITKQSHEVAVQNHKGQRQGYQYGRTSADVSVQRGKGTPHRRQHTEITETSNNNTRPLHRLDSSAMAHGANRNNNRRKPSEGAGPVEDRVPLTSGQTDAGPQPVDKSGARHFRRRPCASNPCRGRRVCQAAGRRYICRCTTGRHGPNCECERLYNYLYVCL